MATNKKRFFKRAETVRHWIRLDQKNPLLYRKEVMYEGDWKKLNSEGEGIAFAVAHNTLNHWKESLRALREAGIKSPLTKSHEDWDQTENKLGEVVNAEVRENDKGLPSLYLDILFADEKSRDIGLKGDVSLGSPPDEWHDGTGRKWTYPLQHVASTNSPVIPGLETWQKIAAAFSASNKSKGPKMDIDELIELLGITVEAGASDDVKAALIKAKLTADYGEAPADGAADPPAPDAVDLSHEEDEAKRKAAAAAKSGGAGGGTSGGSQPMKKVTVAFAHPVIVRTVRDARVAQLDALVEQRVITPATRKELALSFCTDEKIKLELSHDEEGNPIDGGKEFEQTIKFIKLAAKDRPLSASGRSLAGDDDTAIELSHSGKASGVLLKNAEKRAAAAAKK